MRIDILSTHRSRSLTLLARLSARSLRGYGRLVDSADTGRLLGRDAYSDWAAVAVAGLHSVRAVTVPLMAGCARGFTTTFGFSTQIAFVFVC